MRKKLLKKGIGLVEAFSWIAMVFFTILFYILFSLGGCGSGPAEQKMVSEDLTELKMNYDLAAFLRTPVEFKGTKLSVSDAIILAMEDEEIAGGLFPLDNTGISYFFMDSLGLDMIDSAFTQRLSQLKGYPLAYTAANVMKTYSDFVPTKKSIEDYYFCSYKIDATKGNKKIVFYDARYKSAYESLSCAYEYTLAEVKIPDSEGNIIDVRIKATIDNTKAAIDLTTLGVTRLLGIY
jgi:hypothetical protein